TTCEQFELHGAHCFVVRDRCPDEPVVVRDHHVQVRRYRMCHAVQVIAMRYAGNRSDLDKTWKPGIHKKEITATSPARSALTEIGKRRALAHNSQEFALIRPGFTGPKKN